MRNMLIAMLTVAAVSNATAQSTDIDAFFNLSLVPPSYAGCSGYDFLVYDDLTCSELAGLPPATGPFPFLFILKNRVGSGGPGWPDGVGAAQFGITYAGVSFNGGWALCTGGAEIPQDDAAGEWPASGTGNAVTWGGGCHVPTAETAKIGFFALTEAVGSFAITADPRIGGDVAIYTTCTAELFEVPAMNLAGGTLPTDVTCAHATPTRTARWSELKRLF